MQSIEQNTEQKMALEPTPKWVLSVRGLSQHIGPACYRFMSQDGESKTVVLSKRKRQVIDTLLQTELYCASTVRIGDIVFRLKEDEGLFAETRTLSNGRKYYTLAGKVQFVGPTTNHEVAA